VARAHKQHHQKPVRDLPPRQIQVMLAIASDYTTKEIADLLDLSTKTVEYHRQSLSKSINRSSPIAITRYAIARGYVSLTDELNPR
jgi:NarL family two-component system response regulator LiaR